MPYPSMSPSAPAIPERSPLEPLGDYEKRLKKWRSDNAKWAGQLRAIRKLEENPRKVQIPQILK